MLNIVSVAMPEGIVISIPGVIAVETRTPRRRIVPTIDKYGIFFMYFSEKTM